MSQTGPIVIATDLSAGAAHAAELALQLSGALGLDLEIVSASDVLVRHETLPAPIAAFAAALEARVQARTKAIARGLEEERARLSALAPTAKIEARVLDGRPWEALVRHADEVNASLVVLGPHGHGGPREAKRGKILEWLLGSTADRLVRHGSRPLLVAARDEAKRAASLKGGTITVAMDFEDSSVAALDMALAWAQKLDADVEVLHVLQPVAVWDHASGELAPSLPEPHDPELEERLALEGLKNFVAARPSAGPKTRCRVLRGDAAHTIAEESAKSSLLVIGTHGRSGLTHALLGSVAERVLRRALVPVLTVRA